MSDVQYPTLDPRDRKRLNDSFRDIDKRALALGSKIKLSNLDLAATPRRTEQYAWFDKEAEKILEAMEELRKVFTEAREVVDNFSPQFPPVSLTAQ